MLLNMYTLLNISTQFVLNSVCTSLSVFSSDSFWVLFLLFFAVKQSQELYTCSSSSCKHNKTDINIHYQLFDFIFLVLLQRKINALKSLAGV